MEIIQSILSLVLMLSLIFVMVALGFFIIKEIKGG